MTQELLKTGTTTVCIKCVDGVVMGADRRATAGHFIADKRAQKVYNISDNMVLTVAGSVSDIQVLVKLIQAELRLKLYRQTRETTVKEAANLLSGMVYESIRRMTMIPSVAHFLLGGADHHGYHAYDLYPDGSLSEVEDFVSSGSGSVMAYGVLETLYKKDITVKEGTELAVKALNAAIQRDSASGQGIDVVAITKDGIIDKVHKTIDTTVTA